jgi:hypothetical protein
MEIGKSFTIAMMILCCVSMDAQSPKKKIGDLIESTSYNEAKRGTARTLQYQPVDGKFVCVNGKNRFTRALYGSFTEYRIETSDRPVFAVYKKNGSRNISMRLVTADGVSIALDSTAYCRAAYDAGRRDYVLKDARWGDGRLMMAVLARYDRDGGICELRTEGMKRGVKLVVTTSDIRAKKLNRMGDMGADPAGSFEASDRNVRHDTLAISGDDAPAYLMIDDVTPTPLTVRDGKMGKAVLDAAEQHRADIARRITFDTPDEYINALDGALCAAADGDWDGDTWLHGCIGWRMPLAGWRAGYLGDVMGWEDRALSHFDAYAESQVTNVPCTVPHPTQDSTLNLARAVKRWGTPMYSNGYICRLPHRNDIMNHYDMNLNYIDELMWHFCWDADTAYMRKMWPVITRHLAWEKLNYDSDDDGLYDAYCCIWASDALYYDGGSVTHSSAYNYRANKLAARIAALIGVDGSGYAAEADKILRAMNSRLWMPKKGVWAEFQDRMGLKRLHENPALWTIYTAIDCDAATDHQAKAAISWIGRNIPHIPVRAEGLKDEGYQTISTSNWMPYSWSINNVAQAEIMHTALACFEAGCNEEGFRLLKSNVLDGMYIGDSPANFGQLSFYDAARGECYRDFGDVIGISARALVNGLFGVRPDALNGRCIVSPGFPAEWTHASFHAPYLDYTFVRENGCDIYTFKPRFRQPLKIELRTEGIIAERTQTDSVIIFKVKPRDAAAETEGYCMAKVESAGMKAASAADVAKQESRKGMAQGNDFDDVQPEKCRKLNIDKLWNDDVDAIFKHEYTSPAPPYTTLRIPKQGIGEWCHPELTAEINDSIFRTLIADDEYRTPLGIAFRQRSRGYNIAYTSLWDNYPDSIVIPASGYATHAYLLMAGSTNHMQSRIANAVLTAQYADGSCDVLELINPDNWCPIEQDYYEDGLAFTAPQPRPYRVHLGSSAVSRHLGSVLGITGVYGREIKDGAAQMIDMKLDGTKRLKNITLRTLSNDVVIGIMGITLQKK